MLATQQVVFERDRKSPPFSAAWFQSSCLTNWGYDSDSEHRLIHNWWDPMAWVTVELIQKLLFGGDLQPAQEAICVCSITRTQSDY